jgi:ABC-type lipoprotein release transport system permease subunit
VEQDITLEGSKRDEAMIIKVAWKNIWRNKLRSFVIIASTTIGVWSLIFLLSWVFGIVNSFISKSVDYRLGHIQIHHPEYGKEFNVQKSFDPTEAYRLLEDEGITDVSSRIVVQAMVNSARANRGMLIKGISRAEEASWSHLASTIKEGEFIDTSFRNPIVVSKSMAERLRVKLKSKIIANFQDAEGELVAAAFRVSGIYESGDFKLDELVAFTDIKDMRRLTQMNGGKVHEIVMKLTSEDEIEEKQSVLKSKLPELKIENYEELSPDIALFTSQIRLNVIVMTAIFMLALVFGIINTMLMAVLERFRELGMLMAVGMNKQKVFTMIVSETIMLSMIGVPLGLMLGHATVSHLSIEGIDLSNWSEGLRQFGLSHIVRPELGLPYYLFVAACVALTAFLGSLYPSWKAMQLKPVDALRKI